MNRRFRRHHFEENESIITFLCDDGYVDSGKRAVHHARTILQAYIGRVPHFATSHRPVVPEPFAPELIRRMCEVSEIAGVGPMASVAGAVAEAALLAILDAGATEAVVDNGGDIACMIREPLRIGVYTGTARWQHLAFELEPRQKIQGICTSSGTVGRSYSYGVCDAAVVLSDDVLLADAAATALGNRIRTEQDLSEAFEPFDAVKGVRGAMAFLDDKAGLWGTLPPIKRMQVNENLITKGECV